MPYYIRVLGKKSDNIPLEKLRHFSRPAVLRSDVEGDTWERLVLSHQSGEEIAIVEKNPVVEGQLGADELQDFVSDVAEYKPESAARWLQQYLPSIKVIYAFQLLAGTDVEDGWTPLQNLYSAISDHVGGILQSDGEGFSNEEGYTILWQFSDNATGTWKMGVLKDGTWFHFEMDLGNEQHRNAFFSGEVPDGVKTF